MYIVVPYSIRKDDVTHHFFAALVLAAIFVPVGTPLSKVILGLPLQYSSKCVEDVAREKRWGTCLCSLSKPSSGFFVPKGTVSQGHTGPSSLAHDGGDGRGLVRVNVPWCVCEGIESSSPKGLSGNPMMGYPF